MASATSPQMYFENPQQRKGAGSATAQHRGLFQEEDELSIDLNDGG